MKKCCEVFTFVLIWTTAASVHGEYYLGPDYSSAIVRPRKFFESPYDLVPEESSLSKRRRERLTSKKRSPFESSSEEDDSRFVDYNEDSREFTIGTHIRVTHPTSSLKKSRLALTNDDSKSVSYSDINLSNDARPSSKKKSAKYSNSFHDSDAIQVIPPPDSGEVPYSRQSYGPRKASGHGNAFRGVASRNQIEKYLEDQQKILDEAIKLQLLNDPSRHAIGRYQQFLKAQDDERIEKEYEKELIRNKALYKPKANIKSRRPRIFPDDRRPLNPGPPVPVRHYRSPRQPNKIVISI